jgi:glycosyltransferase involved in cell wall biosynthesis
MISIFSKFDMAGGSERRCVELANGIAKYTDHQACILAEKGFPDSLKPFVDNRVQLITDVFLNQDAFYQSDFVLVVNTDCKEFSTTDYWNGKTHRIDTAIDIKQIKKMGFLYNFLISPVQHLYEIAEHVDTTIITTNRKFFNEIGSQERYDKVWQLPRYILPSPISPDRVKTRIRDKAKAFGCHSKKLGSKWNPSWPELVKMVKSRYSDSEFAFMGIKGEIAKEMEGCVCLKEDEKTVADFLDGLDVFVFFPEYKREEPWARVIAEAMMAGLPVIALDKGGTSDQVINNNNGILCRTFEDYYKAIVYLIEHPETVLAMSKNSIRISKEFQTENVIKKLMEIIWA